MYLKIIKAFIKKISRLRKTAKERISEHNRKRKLSHNKYRNKIIRKQTLKNKYILQR